MIEIAVNDMTCGHCASVISKAVREADAGARCEIDLAARKVTADAGAVEADEAEEALALGTACVADRLGLSLSPEKTKVTRFHEGFTFLGFDLQANCVRMRAKSVESFKAKVRRITQRSQNLDAEMLVQLNRVIRGTATYFATPWSHCGDVYRSLDRWIRMRLRCMKFKRKSGKDNFRLRLKHFRHMGLLSLSTLRLRCVAG